MGHILWKWRLSLPSCLKVIRAVNHYQRTMAVEIPQIYNFAFMDLETTGLPSAENNKTKITELNITIVESNHISLGAYPRVLSKLNLCFNPGRLINFTATELTGLDNSKLENQSTFSLNVVQIIKDFLNLHKKPICLVAHNGNRFDFPILRAEIDKTGGSLPEGILCIDSLVAFQDLHNIKEQANLKTTTPTTSVSDQQGDETDMPELKKLKLTKEIPNENSDDFDQFLCSVVDEYEDKASKGNIQKVLETTPKNQIIYKSLYMNERLRNNSEPRKQRLSFKLGDIYKRLTLKDPVNSHSAEGDVECLIFCAASYGEDFVQWANKNAKLFSNVPPMRPGIRIGF